MNEYEDPEIINVGVGSDLTIAELAHLIAEVVGYEGEIVFDTSKPDGTPRKPLGMLVACVNSAGRRKPAFAQGWKTRIAGFWITGPMFASALKPTMSTKAS